MVPPLHISLRRRVRRAIAWLTAIVIFAGASGIPVLRPAPQNTGEAYPCMHHACGCATADACWKECCCYSHEQKLAWAKEHGVRPPDFVIHLAAAEKHSPRRSDPAKCCKSTGCSSHEPSSAEGEDSSWHIVRLEDARQCQGLSSLWLVLSHALPPPLADIQRVELLPTAWLPAPRLPRHSSPAFDPATPPPRFCA